MQFTVKKGTRYAAELKLSGFETMASHDDIKEIAENAGFTDIQIVDVDGNHKILYGVWHKEDMTSEMPSQIVYVEEAPLE